MKLQERELLVARIISGAIRFKTEMVYLIGSPTREQAYIAQEVYRDALRDGELEGLFTDDELLDFLLQNGLWDDRRQKLMEELPKDIEEFKVKLFKLTLRSNERHIARIALKKAKEMLGELQDERHSHNHLSCSGNAFIARLRYSLGCSLRLTNGSPVCADEASGDLLDKAMCFYSSARLGEADYRELARTEPWRSMWAARKSEGSLFGICPADYTEDQRILCFWSDLYDRIFEHPDCPSDDIIEDDDMLDGWLIDQRRQRENGRVIKQGEELLTNEKIRNSSEVFLVADTREDALKIDSLNDPMGSAIKRQRFAHLEKVGEVDETDMPDTKRRIQMEMVRQQMKGG